MNIKLHIKHIWKGFIYPDFEGAWGTKRMARDIRRHERLKKIRKTKAIYDLSSMD